MHCRTYGVCALLGKALMAFLFLTAPLRAEQITVLAFGDSLTQGYGLVEADGLVPQLQAWLNGQGTDVTLINGGVSGDATAGGAARVAWSLTPDVDAMIVTLGGNDLLRGIDPAVSRGNLDAILTTAAEADVDVLLVGMRAPGNYGPAYKTAFDTMYPDLAADHDALLHPYFFSGLGEGTPDALQRYFQADGIHPNADGVARIVEGLGPSVLRLIEQVQ
ncbi:arylesterase [Roseovarius sp. 2305UL8-3]|uniref:arylesterase n=1 Tax=Roseovarius conchicola TaxID=3121636 RepID=UPI0035291374